MTYYEIKKVFSKRSSKISLVIMLAVVVFNLYVIVSDITYVNENGHEERGLGVVAKVRELKKTWAGDLTEDKIRSVIEENIRIFRSPEALSGDVQQLKKADSQKQGFYDLLELMLYDYGGFNF